LLLLLELLDLGVLPLDLSLLIRQLLLYGCILVLSRLHLVADDSAAYKPDCGADACTSAGMSRGAANNGAQAGSGESSNPGPFLPRRQRLGATDKNRRESNRYHDRQIPLHIPLLNKSLTNLLVDD